MIVYTDMIEGVHARTSSHYMCSVVFWGVDMLPDMLTHYHTVHIVPAAGRFCIRNAK